MGKPRAPRPPDMSGIEAAMKQQMEDNRSMFGEYMEFNEAAFSSQMELANKAMGLAESQFDAQMDLAQESMAFAREQWDWQRDTAQEIHDANLRQMRQEEKFTQEMRERYREVGIPLEDAYIEELTRYADPEAREARVGEAVQDTSQALQAARENEMRRLEGFGIDPSQTRSASLDARMRSEGALAQAGTANAQRTQLEQRNLAGHGEATNLARGNQQMGNQSVANMQGLGQGAHQATMGSAQLGMAGYGQGMDMHNAATQTGMAGYGQGMQGMQAAAQNMHQGFGAGLNMGNANVGHHLNMGQLRNQVYGNEIAGYDSAMRHSFGAGLGSLLGVGFGAAGKVGGFGNLFGFGSEGGEVGDHMSPSRGAIPDDVMTALDPGEYVLDEDTVRWHGMKAISKLQKEAQENMPEKPRDPVEEQRKASMQRQGGVPLQRPDESYPDQPQQGNTALPPPPGMRPGMQPGGAPQPQQSQPQQPRPQQPRPQQPQRGLPQGGI